MKNKKELTKRSLVFGIFVVFIGAGIMPSISGHTEQANSQLNGEAMTNFLLDDDYVNVYWKFDDCGGSTLSDSSGHGYDGTINGATWTTDSYTGCALIFDGVDDYVTLDAHSKGLGMNKTDDAIYSFYFKPTGDGLIYSATAPWGYSPELRIELLPTGHLMFKVWTNLCGISLVSSGTYDNEDEWYHAEFYFDGITSNPTIDLYVDDDFDSTVTHWLCEIANDDYGKTKIGAHAYNLSDPFEGCIDEFKIIKYPGGNEQNPPTIDGPTEGEPGIDYDYTFVTDDPEGDNISIQVDWGDGEVTDWIGEYNSGEEVTLSHSWDEGAYEIKARSKDRWYHSSWSEPHTVLIGNQPPSAPTIDGPIEGDIEEELTYTFTAIDPDADELLYYVDWGDGTHDDWFGPFPSGQGVTATHTWDSEDDYEIIAKAKDESGLESDWSEPYLMRIGDEPPGVPDIDGPPSGRPEKEYEFTFETTDPEGDLVYYDINWGDGNSLTDYGPFESGEVVRLNHSWNDEGTVTIEARARDPFYLYSDWAQHNFIVKKSKPVNLNLSGQTLILKLLQRCFEYNLEMSITPTMV